MTKEPPPMTVKCPHCKDECSMGQDNKYRPFCSKRCKLIDFGAWASEEYKVPEEKEAGKEFEKKDFED